MGRKDEREIIESLFEISMNLKKSNSDLKSGGNTIITKLSGIGNRVGPSTRTELYTAKIQLNMAILTSHT